MSIVAVKELKQTLTQEINLYQYRNYHIEGIKIGLLMFNSPSGTFILSIKKQGETIASKSFDCDDIKQDLNTTDDYAYLQKALTFNGLKLKSGTYQLELSSSGYTYSNSSFLGWIRDFNNNTDYFNNTPLSFLIYENKREDL